MTSDIETPEQQRVRERRARSLVWREAQRIKRERYERARAAWARLLGRPYGPVIRGSQDR